MDENTISSLGGFCQELLSNEAFDAMCKVYSQQCAVDILNTQPKHTREREAIYASYQGFEGFLALVKDFANKATQPTTQPAAVATTQDDDLVDDPGVHDIYRTN